MRTNRVRYGLAALTIAGSLVAPISPAGATTPAVSGYRFPVVGGTPEWAAFSTHDEMVAATQVPESVLAGMSTPELVETALNYPLFLDMFAFDSPQRGFDRIVENFNGLRALLARPDAGAALVARYRTLVALFQAGVPAADVDATFMDLVKTEWMLAQRSVLDPLPDDELQVLIDLVMARIDAIRYGGDQDINGPSGEESGLLTAGRALDELGPPYAIDDPAEWTAHFLATGLAFTESALTDVEAAVAMRTVVPDLTSGGIVPTDRDYNSTVRTPKGTSVPVFVMEYELTASQITTYNNYVAQYYPRATRETNASRKYNCHSYAWWSQTTTNTRWMNNPGDDTYWGDGSYSLWHPPLSEKSSYRYSYVDDDHSAFADSTGVHSKWGQYPRMRHEYWYSPYNSTHVDLYYRTGT